MTFHRTNFLFGTFADDVLTGTPERDIVFGLFGNDEISTGAGNDLIFGGWGNDIIDAGAGNDTVIAGFGDDIIAGSGGDDYIRGGWGFDTVTYEGSISDYDISVGTGWFGKTTVSSLVDVADAGSDKLFGVEALYFAADDYTFFLDGTNNAVLAGDDTATTDEDSLLTIAATDLLANDQEFDGDMINIVGVDGTSASGATITFDGTSVSYDAGAIFNDLNVGETATDTFTYTVDDGQGGSDTATVTVTITGEDDTPPLEARINEFHYDNAGSDTGEFIEIRVNTGADVSGVAIELYNGNGGGVYNTLALTTPPVSSDGTYDYYVIDLPANGLQNGGPDGIALSNAGTLIEFLSYEGDFVGVGGTADGVTSTDIGVSEPGDTAIGDSLQREDDGTWAAPTANTSGAANIPIAEPLVARINEFHYDNVGGDENEFVEIRVNAGADVSGLVLELYNGNGGTVYETLTFDQIIPTSDGTYDYYVLEAGAVPNFGSIQNGGPDGLALSNDGALIEFLSYEGTFTAVGGTADGETSTDIGVFEPGDTAIGNSLQREEDGTWADAAPNTAGAANNVVGVTSARINEFHYDDVSMDDDEFIEIRVDAGEDVSTLSVDLYNGNGGASYETIAVSSGTVVSDGTYDYYVIEPSIFQNGPDGIALSNDGTVVEFISYEGDVTATDGPAAGMTSTTIAVSENNGTPEGQSLQLDDAGNWVGPIAETRGAANDIVVQPGEDKLISEIQGSGGASALEGAIVNVEAVVTHVVANGYYLQEEDADADADASTSEGIFVFTGGTPTVNVGNLVGITGEVDEFFGQTQITSVSATVVISALVATPTAAQIMLSPTAVPDYEAVEGMLVSVTSGTPDPLTVIENFNFDRFGQLVISAGVQTQATQLFDAQTQADEIAELQQQNEDNRLILDDGVGSQNPDAFEFVPGGPGDNGNGFLDAGDDFSDGGSTIRLGTELTDSVEGVMSFGFGDYQLVVTETLDIDESTNSGARQDTPDDVGGTLQVASVNVLNYFSTIDEPGAGSGPNGLDPRGADDAGELARQTEKLVAAITGTEAEIFALQEIENGGFGTDSAIQTLVDALNAEAAVNGSGASYAFADPTVDAGFIGTDAITTGIIYDANAVQLLHSEFLVFEESSAATTFALASVLDSSFGDFQRNRPSVAATFEDLATGETFTVVSSHFKSKGPSSLNSVVSSAQSALDNGTAVGFTQADVDALIADPNYDQGDGQGFWNQVRLDAAIELGDWIANDYNGGGTENYVLLGDLNAYAEEDPVQHLDDDAGLNDLIDDFIGQDEAYSFVFDGQRGSLDHGLADDAFAGFVTGATEWHINADEPDLIGYDTSFTNPDFYNDGVFAASDHDPLIIGLDFGGPMMM